MHETALRGEGSRERHEAIDGNVFGPCGRAQAGCRKESGDIDAERPQALPQHFPPLAKRGLGDGFEKRPVAG
jgi:hypothetical protein